MVKIKWKSATTLQNTNAYIIIVIPNNLSFMIYAICMKQVLAEGPLKFQKHPAYLSTGNGKFLSFIYLILCYSKNEQKLHCEVEKINKKKTSSIVSNATNTPSQGLIVFKYMFKAWEEHSDT